MHDPLTPEMRKLSELFYPYATERADVARTSNTRFAHYCSAENAKNILQGGQVWLRRASAMNDFREIEYGHHCLISSLQRGFSARLNAAVESIFPGMKFNAEQIALNIKNHVLNQTYITCLSEHLSSEDNIGRLSMWRAYGGRSGVALVLNGQGFLTPSDVFAAYTSPVYYTDEKGFDDEFEKPVTNIERNIDFIRGLGPDYFISQIWGIFRAALICTKHRGFKEEREWRVFYDPTLDNTGVQKMYVETIRGLPQHVCKISLMDQTSPEYFQYNNLIERIIIGPMDHPIIVADALAQILHDKKVSSLERKVFLSDIPLRHD